MQDTEIGKLLLPRAGYVLLMIAVIASAYESYFPNPRKSKSDYVPSAKPCNKWVKNQFAIQIPICETIVGSLILFQADLKSALLRYNRGTLAGFVP